MGLINDDPDLRTDEQVLVRVGASHFPDRVVFSAGGVLYLTTQRVMFLPSRLDTSLSRGDDNSVDLALPEITAVGSTPRWRPLMGRRFLRLDAGKWSYLFLFSVQHLRWRVKFQDELLIAKPSVARVDGWGMFA